MKIDPNAPAYPNTGAGVSPIGTGPIRGGMTIRTKISAMAMQGILAAESEDYCYGDHVTIARHAVKHADALIAELNKEQPDE